MATQPMNRQTPEERELEKKKAELEGLESQLADRELEMATLQADLSVFEQRYLSIVGARYAELDALNARIAEEDARMNPKDSGAKEKAAQARSRAEESAQSVGTEEPPIPQNAFNPSEDMKKLFREAAKTMHPDLTTDPAERARRNKLMAEVNQAYRDGDQPKLEAILRAFSASPEAVKGEGTGPELVRAIRKIAQVEERLKTIEGTLTGLKATDLHVIFIKAKNAEAEGRDLLSQMAWQVVTEIAAAREDLTQLVGKGRR